MTGGHYDLHHTRSAGDSLVGCVRKFAPIAKPDSEHAS